MTLFKNRVFADIIKVKIEMRSLGWAINPMEVSLWETEKSTQICREEGQVETEAEIGVMQPQKGGQEP